MCQHKLKRFLHYSKFGNKNLYTKSNLRSHYLSVSDAIYVLNKEGLTNFQSSFSYLLSESYLKKSIAMEIIVM